MSIGLIFSILRFELSKSMTVGRIAIWILLVAFPVALIATVSGILELEPRKFNEAERLERLAIAMYYLIPEVICLLGLLLWATPVIATETEGQTWIYLAMRSSGRVSVIIGKYLTAIVWTFSAALAATAGCVYLVDPPDAGHLFAVITGLSALSCLAHGAIFLVIGVFFHRRTMVMAVVYTLTMEYGMALVPAVINELIVNFRLRVLFNEWTDWHVGPDSRLFEEAAISSPPVQIAALLVMTVGCLIAALLLCRIIEFPTQQEG